MKIAQIATVMLAAMVANAAAAQPRAKGPAPIRSSVQAAQAAQATMDKVKLG